MANSKLRSQSIGLLFGYGLQFLAGMLLNLFVMIPKNHSGRNATNYFSGGFHGLGWALADHGGWELSFHVDLAILLVLGSVSLFIRATSEHDKDWSIVGAIAALFTIGAFFNGLSFINYNHNISSMIMAICWLVAVSALMFGIVNFAGKAQKNKLAVKTKH
jgi:hypothetical protein